MTFKGCYMNKKYLALAFTFLALSACSLDEPDAPRKKETAAETASETKTEAAAAAPPPAAAEAPAPAPAIQGQTSMVPANPTVAEVEKIAALPTIEMPIPPPAPTLPPYHQMVADNQIAAVQAALKEKGMGPFTQIDSNGRLPIHYATTKEMVSLLWKLPRAFRVVDANGEKAFHVMARDGHLSAIEFVLNARCGPISAQKLNNRDSHGRTILHLAVENGSIEVVKAILACSWINLTATDSMNQSTLHYAVMHDDFTIGKMLLAKGAKALLPLKDSDGKTALDLARSMNNAEAIKVLAPASAPTDLKKLK